MEEIIESKIDTIRCWESKKPGVTIHSSFLGALVLTDQRLLFLSTGGSKLLGSMIGAAGGGALGAWAVRKVLTKGLDLSDLSKPGSCQIPLDKITVCEAKTTWGSGAYLTVCFRDNAGNDCWRSFMSRLKKPTLKMEVDIQAAKAAHESRKSEDQTNG